jgi:nucleotide-binding universal stress UspA family protein
MRKILVPVDFSEFSMNALDVAIYIARVKEMTIRLLHVTEDSYTPYYNMVGIGMVEENTLYTYRKELERSLNDQLSEQAEKIRQKNISVEYQILDGTPYKSIIDDAGKQNADLIVMGSHGHNDIEDIFIGGTSEKVIRLSPIPVLTVYEARENYSIDKIVFASDFKEPEVEPILLQVIDFAELFMAELFLVRINTPSDRIISKNSRKKLDELAARFNLSAGSVTTYSDRSEEEGIVNYSREVGADLIAMCTHGRTGLARLFKGSLAEEVAGFSNIPVLTFNIVKDKLVHSSQPILRKRKLILDPGRKKSAE